MLKNVISVKIGPILQEARKILKKLEKCYINDYRDIEMGDIPSPSQTHLIHPKPPSPPSPLSHLKMSLK